LFSFAATTYAGDDAARSAHERDLLRNAHSSASRLRTDAALSTGYEQWIFIPAAGSVRGNFGTFYKSDLQIANYRPVAQVIRARWIPQGGSGFSTQTQYITIPANSVYQYNDAVATLMLYSGLGSLEFVARTSLPPNDSIDLNAQIDAFSRIWTPQPNTTLGTVSQNFGATGIFQIIGNSSAFALGLKQDTNYRTNVGILNEDFSTAHTWTVKVAGTGGATSFTITVPAFSMMQASLPAGNWGDLYVEFIPPGDLNTSVSWTAYGSSNDNGTGDGWVSLATQINNH